jgi:ADP-ribosyl-[dinitrogen reductase] hydrolase
MKPRTSHSHPLEIATVETAPGFGPIGITFCPGKVQPHGTSGAWSRDLPSDAEVIRAWGAAAVVTLIEDHEMTALGVQALGPEMIGRHMDWLHLPIADVSVPGPEFERAWSVHGESLRARLRDGFGVLVHCKGGLGRAGTIAARLLVELGHAPETALKLVRDVRPGAVETDGQVAYVRALGALPEHQPDTSADAIGDRAAGALLGLAVGDAVGTTLEFKVRDNVPLLTDMVGGGPFALRVGEWTDDTAMALALADSLSVYPDLDEGDLMRRFGRWLREGAYSCTGTCFRHRRDDAPSLVAVAGDGRPCIGLH